MKSSLGGIRVLVAVWLALSLCYTAYLLLEYKNSLEISGPEQKMQRIEESTDIVQLKRTSKMYVDFLYGVHNASLRLWAVNVGFAMINTALLAHCVYFIGRSYRCPPQVSPSEQ